MGILQALFSFLGRSAGKILNAIFGWAVRALFGPTSSSDQTALSALVGAAAVWPVFLVGVAAPKVMTLILAFVPLPKWVSGNVVRVVWIGLAVIIPLAVGLAVAKRRPPSLSHESFTRRLWRGFPITAGLAGAFILMFVSVPLLRLADVARRRRAVSLPLQTDAGAYHDVARVMVNTLNRRGFALAPSEPTFWVRAPVAILKKLGGDAFRAFLPEYLEHYRGPDLELALYPSAARLRGSAEKTAWAHGLISEALVHSRGLQTVDPQAQAVEREIKRVWELVDENPRAHTNSEALEKRLRDIAEEIASLHVPYDEWQVLYREALQLSRALHGERQLLERQG